MVLNFSRNKFLRDFSFFFVVGERLGLGDGKWICWKGVWDVVSYNCKGEGDGVRRLDFRW